MSPLAVAMAEAVRAHGGRRVPLATLMTAAAAIDRTGALAVTWRTRVASAIAELTGAGLVDLPTTKWDVSADPRLPLYLLRVAADRPPPVVAADIVWHAELGWAAQLDAAGRLSPGDRRTLSQVNTWLRRRGQVVVPHRERSLDIFGDEKKLDGVVFSSLFGAGRLTYRLLLCEPCRPPVHQEILGGGPWLLVENWTTFQLSLIHI